MFEGEEDADTVWEVFGGFSERNYRCSRWTVLKKIPAEHGTKSRVRKGQ